MNRIDKEMIKDGCKGLMGILKTIVIIELFIILTLFTLTLLKGEVVEQFEQAEKAAYEELTGTKITPDNTEVADFGYNENMDSAYAAGGLSVTLIDTSISLHEKEIINVLMIQDTDYDKSNPKYLSLPEEACWGEPRLIEITKTAQEIKVEMSFRSSDIDFNSFSSADNPVYQIVDGDGVVYSNLIYNVEGQRLVN